jgi:hypothetical protein
MAPVFLYGSKTVMASAVAFSHEAEGRSGKPSRMSAESTNLDRHGPMGLATTEDLNI